MHNYFRLVIEPLPITDYRKTDYLSL